MVTRALGLALIGLAGCGSFQDPNVVVDLRILAMRSEPPDQVVDVDLTRPVMPSQLLSQLVPTQICALVADPTLDRRLLWSMTLCPTTSTERCADSDPQVVLGAGLVDDPDTTVPEPSLCATAMPDVNLLAVLLDVLQGDTLHGLGGVDYMVVLRIGGENADRDLDQYAAKILRVSPRIPAAHAANQNPGLDRIDAVLEDAAPVALPLGRCAENPAPYSLAPGTKLRLQPIESTGAREVYVVPTLDGRSETFTESLTYQWIAGAGGYSHGSTGGPRDLSGNPAPLFSDYKSPAAADLDGPIDVPLWIVQRDERLGVHWYESCLRVAP
ncbi:MAG: hypothetical protein E6J90_07295 [Deltaproteobacteria bacterium]|nr:MAG: hypothetical protein E6J90_07295 [Deltaproteobacteria bacterium]